MSEDLEKALNDDPRYQILTGADRVMKRKQFYEAMGTKPPEYIAAPGTKELNPEGPVHKYVRPTLEGAGMISGGMIGGRSGPVGAAKGAVIGYALADTASSALERMAGERPPISSVTEALVEPVKAMGRGGVAEAVGQIGNRLVGATKALAPFSNQYEKQRTLDEAAQAKGITLDPHEVLQSRPLALGHKVLENIPFTSGLIQRKEMVKLEGLTKEWQRLQMATGTKDRARMGELGQRIQDTIEKDLDRIGVRQEDIRTQARDTILRDIGSPLSYKELGEQTQTVLREHHAGLKAVEKLAWQNAEEAIPNARVVTSTLPAEASTIRKEYENLQGFLEEPLLTQLNTAGGSGNKAYDLAVKKANEIIPTGLPADMRKKLIDEEIARSGEQPGWRVGDLIRLRSALGDAASAHHTGIQRGDATKGAADAYGRIYGRLMGAVDKDLEAFGATQGSDVAERFAAARIASGARLSFFNPKQHPAVMRAINADPSRVASALIQPGTAAGYASLRDIAGPQAVEPVKKAFTNELMGIGGKEAEGLAGLRAKLDRYGHQTLGEVYSQTELGQLYALANRANWQKHSPIGNPFFRELIKTAPTHVAPAILESPSLTEKVLRQFPKMHQTLREAFVAGLKPNAETPFPTTMLKMLNAYPKEVQQRLFSTEELRDFTQMANIVSRTKGTVSLAENPAGTAQNIVSFTTGAAVLHHPVTMTPTVLGTTGLAKLYTSKLGRKYLLEGLVTPIYSSKGAHMISQMLGIAGVNAVRDVHDQTSRRLGLSKATTNLEQGK